MFFTSVGPQDTHCHTMYLLQLGTGFDRVLNTLALYGVVQLNSQTNASFTRTMSLCFCHLLAQEWSKSVSFPNAMVQLVLMGGGVMASSLVPAETSFYIQAWTIFSRNSGIQLSSSLACGSEHFMHGRCRGSQVPSPFLGSSIQGGNLAGLGTTQSDWGGWDYCPCLPSCPALRPLPGLLGSSRSLLSSSRLTTTLTSCCRGTWTSGLGTGTWGSAAGHSTRG